MANETGGPNYAEQGNINLAIAFANVLVASVHRELKERLYSTIERDIVLRRLAVAYLICEHPEALRLYKYVTEYYGRD